MHRAARSVPGVITGVTMTITPRRKQRSRRGRVRWDECPGAAGSAAIILAGPSASAQPPTLTTHSVATALPNHSRAARAGSVILVGSPCHPPRFTSFEATCNDGTEPVPRPIRRCGDSIGQNQPRGGMVVIPAGPQRARETRRGAGQTGRPTTPSRFPLLHGLDRWAKGDRALRTIGSPRLDPQQGAPARRLDGAIQPLRIPPAIRHHDDRPSRGRSRPDERAPPFPGDRHAPFGGAGSTTQTIGSAQPR
jgi:hypothetical protein